MMTLDEFEVWLCGNPEHFGLVSPVFIDKSAIPTIPNAYQEFLSRFGPLNLFGHRFLPPTEVAEITNFVHDLSHPLEGVDFHHLMAFCSQGYDCCYFCFDGEKVVDFDPLEPTSSETIVAQSFEEFLGKFVEKKGVNVWQSSSEA